MPSETEIGFKKRYLSELKSEVKEFHPMLELLLPKLNSVNNVEYTHGTNEFGADFVVERIDPALNDVRYVAVVVKIGKIRQDLGEIERQIKECKIPRIVGGGSKKIVTNEIWIITNETISSNAKQKINYEYSGSSITFVDREKLIQLIDEHIPYVWHKLPSRIGEYLLALEQRTSEYDKQTSLLRSNTNTYIELDVVREDDSDYEKRRQIKNVSVEKEIDAHKAIYIEGSMGAGKSKLLRKLVSVYANDQAYTEKKRIPILTSFPRIVSEYEGDIEKATKGALGEDGYNEAIVDSAHFLLMIDGVDEYHDDNKDAPEQLSHILNQAKQLPRYTIVLTSRPIRDLEQQVKLEKFLTRYTIRPLSFMKIVRFIMQLCSELNIPKRLYEDLRRSELFNHLPRTPIAAILLTNLLTEEDVKELPATITDLYDKSSELMLGKWDIDKGIVAEKEYHASERICGGISEYMIDNNLSAIAISEAKDIVIKYLGARNLDLNPEKLFQKLSQRTGVLFVDNTSGITFFRHRSFAEFLYAKHKYKTEGLEATNRAFEPYWANIYLFHIGLKKDCPEYLREIFSCPTTTAQERWMKVINAPNYLLAAYTTPYKIVEETLYKLFLEAATLYLEMKNGAIKSNLTELPEINVLYLIQLFIRQFYGFEFFEPAMETAVVQIKDSLEDDTTKIYATFFAGAVSLELGLEEPFKFLLNTYSPEKYPLTISIALSAEMKQHKELGKSALMKRHMKKFKKLLKGLKGKNLLEAVQEKPMKMLPNYGDSGNPE